MVSSKFESESSTSDAIILPRRINLFPLEFMVSGTAHDRIPATLTIEEMRDSFVNKLRSAGATLRHGERGFGFLDDERMVVQHPASDTVQMAHTVRFSFEPLGGRLFLAIDPTVSVRFLLSLAELIALGVPRQRFVDLLVRQGEAEESSEDGPPIQTGEGGPPLYIKCVKDGPGGELIAEALDNQANTQKEIDARTLFLVPNQTALGLVLDHLGKKDAFIKAHRKASLLEGDELPRKRLQRARNHAKNLLTKGVFPLACSGVQIEFRASEISVSDDPFEDVALMPEPLLQFDPEDGSRSHSQPYHGLRNYGPYHRGNPIINVALLGPSDKLGRLRELVSKLNDGSGPLPGGARRFLHCELKIVGESPVQGTTAKAYEQAAAFLAENYASSDPVAICLLPQRTEEDSLDTPYYGAKTKLASRGICSQMITIEKLNNQWAQPDILMGIYAKAGSVPWALTKGDPLFDLVLGVDVAIPLAQNRLLRDKKRFVGTASVFNGRGVWLNQINTHQRYDPNRASAQMAEIVDRAIKTYSDRFSRSPKAIAIHYYKKFGKEEREAITRAAIALDPAIQIAFISIDSSHCFRLYDLSTQDGSYARGGFVPLDSHRFLLATTGDSSIAGRKMGTPKILKVTNWQEPTVFASLEEIAEQILGLTKINYKSLTPIQREPVTLSFSADVARLAGAFAVSDWDTAPSESLERKLWFL